MKKILLVLIFSMTCDASYGCYSPPVKIAELNGQPIVHIFSENAKYLLEMHPAKWSEKNKERWSSKNNKFTVTKESLGIVYRVAEDGLMTPIWEVEGTYPRGFIKGRFPFHSEKYTFYLANDGRKIIRVLDKRAKSKSLISIYDQSGILTELPHDSISMMKDRRIAFHCGGLFFFNSHRFRADDVLEFQPLQKTKTPKTWEMFIHTGELRKQPN